MMQNLKLLSGYQMPILGMGTWKSDEIAVRTALEKGYRLLDCGHFYGNETEVGAALKNCISRGIVKREEVFITSKLWMTKMDPNIVRSACEKTLTDLGCNYIDLYLIHWPIGFQDGEDLVPKTDAGDFRFSYVDYLDTYKAMELLVDAGLVRSIGLSNCNKKQIQRVWDAARIKPSVLQIEIHPYCKNLPLTQFAKSLGMQVTAYASLGSLALFPSTSERPAVINDPTVVKIAARHGKTQAQVLIRYSLDREIGAIPKTINPDRIEENMKVLDFKLTEEDLDELNAIAVFDRLHDFAIIKDHPDYPFNEEY